MVNAHFENIVHWFLKSGTMVSSESELKRWVVFPGVVSVGNTHDWIFLMMMKMVIKIINNKKFYWLAIFNFQIFGLIGRSFICLWEARDSRKMGFGCFSYGLLDITFLAFRAKVVVLFAFLPQLIIPSRWIQGTSDPTPPSTAAPQSAAIPGVNFF